MEDNLDKFLEALASIIDDQLRTAAFRWNGDKIET